MKKSRKKNGLIFKATFTQDTPKGTECFVKYGYNPSWDFVKNVPLTCVAQCAEDEAAEKPDDAEAPEAPEASCRSLIQRLFLKRQKLHTEAACRSSCSLPPKLQKPHAEASNRSSYRLFLKLQMHHKEAAYRS